MENIKAVDDKNFETEVLNSELPVLVDFSAEWCGPCTRQLPIIEKFAQENKDKIKVVSVDIEEASTIASKFGIKSIPSLLYFVDGKNVGMRVGLTSLSELNKLTSI